MRPYSSSLAIISHRRLDAVSLRRPSQDRPVAGEDDHRPPMRAVAGCIGRIAQATRRSLPTSGSRAAGSRCAAWRQSPSGRRARRRQRCDAKPRIPIWQGRCSLNHMRPDKAHQPGRTSNISMRPRLTIRKVRGPALPDPRCVDVGSLGSNWWPRSSADMSAQEYHRGARSTLHCSSRPSHRGSDVIFMEPYVSRHSMRGAAAPSVEGARTGGHVNLFAVRWPRTRRC